MGKSGIKIKRQSAFFMQNSEKEKRSKKVKKVLA
jgi:hypothetical protein